MKKTLIAALLIGLMQNAFATKVTECPSVVALTDVGIESVLHLGHNKWIAGVTQNDYNTGRLWAFGMGVLDGANTQEALEAAKLALPTLTLQGGPISSSDDIFSLCIYGSELGYFAAAVTPTIPLNNAKMLSLVMR